MKTMFVEAKANFEFVLHDEEVSKLPNKIGLVCSLQYAEYLPRVNRFLEHRKIKVFVTRGTQKYPGQITGCDVSAAQKIAKKVDGFLYFGDGSFHPGEVYRKTKKDVFTMDVDGKISKLDKNEIEKSIGKEKAAYVKFLSSENIGVIVSTKQGQNALKKAMQLKQNKKYKDKNFYVIVFDTIDFGQLENFNFIDCFVNTACPRMVDDYDKFPRPVLNIEYLQNEKTRAS